MSKGDTLYGIARRTRTSPEEIIELNDIDKEATIFPGQKLKIPGAAPVNVNPVGSVSGKKPIVADTTTSYSGPRTIRPMNNDVPHFETVEPRFAPTPIAPNYSPPRTVSTRTAPKPIRPTKTRSAPPVVIGPETTGGSYSTYSATAPGKIATYGATAPAATTVRPIRSGSASYNYKSVQPNYAPMNESIASIPPDPSVVAPLALPDSNPLDKYGHVIAYRVQLFDNLKRIADAHSTTTQELIETNGRTQIRKGEMIVIPVDNALIKNGF